MRVVELVRYPVKSMGGESLDEVEVGELGLDGDRSWSVHDSASGTTLTARRVPALLFAAARLVDGDLVVELPDGRELGAGDHAALSAWLERDVELRSAAVHAVESGGTYENPMDAEHDADWVSWQGPAGAFHDSGHARVSLVSTGSLGGWDRRRFRSNLIVDGAGEDDLVGRSIGLGGARLDVVKPIDRCVMVTRPQPGLDRDLEVLRTIAARRDGLLSVGCLVAAPGRVAVGDEVVDAGAADG